MARGMILKEAGTLPTDDTEIGDIDTHKKMKVQSKDQVLARKNYNGIVKPLCK